jgi:hypothetical protein
MQVFLQKNVITAVLGGRNLQTAAVLKMIARFPGSPDCIWAWDSGGNVDLEVIDGERKG